jgi:ADP-heptose:LPS heptosyltransferase
MKLWLERGAWASKKAKNFFSRRSRFEIRRVAVIRHAALGDMVILRPFLIELRRFFPSAKIVLSLVSNYTVGAPVELVDEVHIVTGKGIKISLWKKIQEYRELSSVEIIFDLADTTRSRYICMFNSRRIRVGMSYSKALSYFIHDACVWRSDFVFEAENMLHTLMLLGANPRRPLDFGWNERGEGSEIKISEVVLYFPFASHSGKIWPIKHWIELLLTMGMMYPNLRHEVLSGVGEHESATEFLHGMSVDLPNVHALSRMDLMELLTKIQSSRLLVANDTGVRNLAISTSTSTVGIFFSTVPFRYLPNRPNHLAVFDSNGDIPSVRDTFESITESLNVKC